MHVVHIYQKESLHCCSRSSSGHHTEKQYFFFLQVFNLEVLFVPLNLALNCACQFKRMRLSHASPIFLRLDFPWVFLSAQGLFLIRELPEQCTGLLQGQEQELAPGIHCPRMKNLVQISQNQGQACMSFPHQNCSSSHRLQVLLKRQMNPL